MAGFGGTALKFWQPSGARRRVHLLYRCNALPMQSTMRDFDPRRGEFGVRTCRGVLIPSQGPEDAVRSIAGRAQTSSRGRLSSRTSMGLGFGVHGCTRVTSIAGVRPGVRTCDGRQPWGDVHVLASNRAKKTIGCPESSLP
jgi:hypothetical protein